MYLNLLLIVFAFFGISNENNISSNTEILTGGNSKSWNIISSLPIDSVYSCGFPNPHSLDNTWTFSIDNTFSFDPGQLTSTTYSNRFCVDKPFYSGTWSFIENETALVMIINEIENVPITPITINTSIQSFNTSEVVLIINDEDGLTTYIYTPK